MSLVGDRTRRLLAQSVHLLESHKDRLIDSLETSLGACEAQEDSFGHAEVTAMILTELLIEQGRSLVDWGELRLSPDTAAEHRALDIGGRHYSRFGDVLVPVIRDVLGPRVPREVASAWCDAFWAVIGAVSARAEVALA